MALADPHPFPFPIPPAAQLLGEPAILLDRDHADPAGEQLCGEAPLPRPDLEHQVVRRGIERGGDLLEEPGIGKEMLAEAPPGRHAWSNTTVRSSSALVPSVNASNSTKMASRIS